jgi:hypothetical protein
LGTKGRRAPPLRQQQGPELRTIIRTLTAPTVAVAVAERKEERASFQTRRKRKKQMMTMMGEKVYL